MLISPVLPAPTLMATRTTPPTPNSAEEAAQAFLQDDTVSVQATAPTDPERAAKESVIRGMVRKSPDEAVTARMVDVLCAWPLEALKTVSAYGTRIEAYDFEAGEAVPEYLPSLAGSGVVGAYNTRANVLGFDRRNADTFTILHEFAHALDAALNEPSASPEWKNAFALASNTNRTVRDYAKSNVSEYMAEMTCAYLVPDAGLPSLVERGLSEGALGLDDHSYMQMCQNLSNERLHSIDPDGWKLVDALMHRGLAEAPRRAPLPAMTPEQWHAFEKGC
jgi:hypothetical protein